MNASATDTPAPLVVAASLVAVEGIVLALLGILELFSLSSDRVVMGVTTTLFFIAYGAFLVACGWSVHRRRSWARSPIVLTQLIMLGLAWNYRDVPVLAAGLAIVALVVVVGMLHPDSIEALSDES